MMFGGEHERILFLRKNMQLFTHYFNIEEVDKFQQRDIMPNK